MTLLRSNQILNEFSQGKFNKFVSRSLFKKTILINKDQIRRAWQNKLYVTIK
jgi:proteasome assembly chaperone (PAC2) family protein